MKEQSLVRPHRGASSAEGGDPVTHHGRVDLALHGPSPPPEDKRRVIALAEVPAALTLGDGRQTVGLGRGGAGMSVSGGRRSVWEDEEVLETVVGTAA